ncbi:hypothetical protein MNBD_GAMMA22-2311 [hydrothermal vent metagenome]|uniref:CheW-like domain-containing protein n=1 Tax=hydrothermal vent metagenome TaxID=652676 RepID=A0A3B1A1J8_9ZZZZ
MPEVEQSSSAWLLHVANNVQFCIGLHQAAEYIEEPTIHSVPMAPAYCNHVLFWRDDIIPVVDINLLAGHPATQSRRFVMVIAYQVQDNAPIEHLAVLLESAPHKIQVNDKDACEIPKTYPERLKPYVMSLFKYKDEVASVLNIAQMSIGRIKRV